MIRNIIFDWSGTLVDDLPATLAATNYVLRKAGKSEMAMDQFRAEFCLPFTHFYERHTPDVPLPELEKWFHEHFFTASDSVLELPHARDFLECCRQRGIRTFLLSSVHRNYFASQTSRNGFHELLDQPYVGVWDKRTKILEILAENNLKTDETLFVGDMQHDIDTARHGGVHSCAVLTGFNRLEQLRASEPDVIVEHLGELRALLEHNGWQWPTGTKTKISPGIPIATVGALIYDDNERVLMIRTHKWSDLWGIPGGKIKLNESSEDALRRELKEETDLDITDIRFVLVQDCIQSREFYREAHFILLNYTCRCIGKPAVTLNEEAQEFCWVSPQEALKMPLNQPTRILLLAVTKL